MKTPLITVEEMKEFIGITSNLNTQKDLDPHIIGAQDLELRNFCGESFYLAIEDDLLSSPSLVEFEDLWNGSRYQYGGKDYQHDGLKAVLIWHSYARHLAHVGIKSTPSGMMNKLNQYSEKASDQSINRLIKEARSMATAHENRVKCFLERNKSDYPLYDCGKKSGFRSGMKIKRIN